MVITKSLARVARNAGTLLATVQELKLLKVDVYFEKGNIYTLDAKGEVMLAIIEQPHAGGKLFRQWKCYLGQAQKYGGREDFPDLQAVSRLRKILTAYHRLWRMKQRVVS